MKITSILFCLLFFIAADLFTPAKAQVNVNDSLALVDLYNSTNGPNWFFLNTWALTKPVSTWYGVTVRDSRVTGLYLLANNLSGSIPASIGNLEMLDSLNLSINPLSGAIPAELGNLVNLKYLNLSFCRLSGPIPDEIGNCISLTELELSSNDLSGTVPASIGNCTNLIRLWIELNQLNGSIPPTIGNLINLTDLELSANQLSGAIPAEMGNCTKLTSLQLDDNQLSSTIPASIGNLVNLTDLELSANQLSGPIPAEMGKLVNLGLLDLQNNQLSGPIPPEMGNLAKLGLLYLSNNQLSGAIPAEMGKLKNLSYLLLDHNQLSGSIVPPLRTLNNLIEVNLSYNQLSQVGNISFSKDTNYYTRGFINNNLFTFDGLEFIAKDFPNAVYSPQANITIHQNGNTLSVYAGGTLSNNTYRWHQVGDTNIISITGDSTFTPSQSGKYYVNVFNKVAKQLTLRSDTFDFTLSPLKTSSILITKKIQPATVIKHMQVYPNPAKEVVHVQVNGTAVVAITNSNGKVLLTKSINNSDAINVGSLASGIYYLQNKTTGEVQKIVVAH